MTRLILIVMVMSTVGSASSSSTSAAFPARRPGRPGAEESPRDADTHRDAVVDVTDGFNQTGSTKAPSPAESHTANRTHDLPLASNGIVKRFVPNGPRSVAETI